MLLLLCVRIYECMHACVRHQQAHAVGCFDTADSMCSEDKSLAVGSLRSKEPQYFNRWPLPPVGQYLHAWHSGIIGAMVSDTAGRRVLLDASPQYLMCAAAPPRIQAVIPHARFIMVVRVRPPHCHARLLLRPLPRPARRSPAAVYVATAWQPFTCVRLHLNSSGVNASAHSKAVCSQMLLKLWQGYGERTRYRRSGAISTQRPMWHLLASFLFSELPHFWWRLLLCVCRRIRIAQGKLG